MLGLANGLTDCLVGDLAEMGVSADEIAALPRCSPPPIGRGHAEMIGARSFGPLVGRCCPAGPIFDRHER